MPTCTAGHPEHQIMFQFPLPFPRSPNFPLISNIFPCTSHSSTIHTRVALVSPFTSCQNVVHCPSPKVLRDVTGRWFRWPLGDQAGQSELSSVSLHLAIGRPRMQHWVRFHWGHYYLIFGLIFFLIVRAYLFKERFKMMFA